MALNSFLDSILGFLLSWNPLIAIIILSLFISLLITIIYKYATNQSLLKDIKDEMKRLQELSKTLRDNPSEMMSTQKRMMDLNMKYMLHGFRATLITFLPIILLFGWMTAHFSFIPIAVGEPFTTTVFLAQQTQPINVSILTPPALTVEGNKTTMITQDKATYTLTGTTAGTYDISIVARGKAYAKEVSIGQPTNAITATLAVNDDTVKTISIDYKKRILIDTGWLQLGWLGTYFLFSIIFSIGLRKVMNVY